MKVVVNRCYGGFGLSNIAVLWLRERGHEAAIKEPIFAGEKWSDGSIFSENHARMFQNAKMYSADRSDPLIVECVENLGKDSWGVCAKLEVVEIPDDIQWKINEYDGMEHIEEVHRRW